MKHDVFTFEPPWSLAFTSNPSRHGIWIVWGREKNGKTSFVLMLVKYLSTKAKVWYLSAEEGFGKEFCEAVVRAGITENDRNITISEYEPLEEVMKELRRKNSADVVVFDNLTVYRDELKKNVYQFLKAEFPDKLFIFVAHEERKEPSPSTAVQCKKLAKTIVHIKGLRATVSGRGVSGIYDIDEEKAELYWGGHSNEE
jgi:KaiC/GvpD/RAD55 family RecA-like ATPase